jgi:hypothetical protein
MTTGSAVIRVVIGIVGALLLLGGLALAVSGVEGGILGAFWMILSGAVLVIAALIEVSRYRSEHAERARMDPGPGGGESQVPLEPRFRPTEEVFVDPTSQRRMRVYADARTGERRYVAEG